MSSMFDTYENLSDQYIPDNRKPKPVDCDQLKPYRPKKPYEEYDVEGNLIGYWWYYGDTIALEFNIDGQVTIDSNGENDSYIEADEFLKNKQINVQIYNFRHEQVAIRTFDGATTITFDIDKELSDKLVKGTYYCSLTVYDENHNLIATLFSDENGILIVK